LAVAVAVAVVIAGNRFEINNGFSQIGIDRQSEAANLIPLPIDIETRSHLCQPNHCGSLISDFSWRFPGSPVGFNFYLSGITTE